MTSNPLSEKREIVGSRWRGASGGVWTVERVENGLAYGTWDSGVPWNDFVAMLPKLYVEVDGGPKAERPA